MALLDTFLVIDTETTGFGPTARILEVGLVVFEKGEPVHEWSRLFCPSDVDWNNERVKEALAVNKLTVEELAPHKPFADAVVDLTLELMDHEVWVFHNAEFDLQMLRQEFTWASSSFEPPELVVCTKELASYFSNEKGNKLAQVAARYGVQPDGAHRAVSDAVTCGRVFHAMVRSGKLPDSPSALKELLGAAHKAWKTKPRW